MKVKEIKKEHAKPLMTIETETDRSFLCIKLKPLKRTFIANKEYPKGYWNWVELPNKTIIEPMLSFWLNNCINFDV